MNAEHVNLEPNFLAIELPRFSGAAKIENFTTYQELHVEVSERLASEPGRSTFYTSLHADES